MSMALNGELICGVSCPWLSTAMKCLTAETTPLARGAADAEHLLSSVVELCDRHPLGRVSTEIYGRAARGPETLALMDRIMHFVNAVDDAIVEVLDLLCLQVKACCNNQNSINEFLAKATEAYHHIDGGLIQSQAHLVDAYENVAAKFTREGHIHDYIESEWVKDLQAIHREDWPQVLNRDDDDGDDDPIANID